jgi:uncharacterized protein
VGTTSIDLGTVTQLWRFPVKSLQGDRADELVLGPAGPEGDRQWGVIDAATGKVLTAKRWRTLLDARARIDPGGAVVITLPDGTDHTAGDRATDVALSAWLGREVRLRRPPAAATAYELTMDPTDDSSETWDFATPPGSFVDLAAVHLITDASLAAAAALGPGSDWDVRRFRPTIVVGVDEAGFVEDDWIGGRLVVGHAVVEPFMRTPRCAMPTRAQPGGLARDTGVSRTLTDRHGNDLGVYASVARPGPVRVGDSVVTEPRALA